MSLYTFNDSTKLILSEIYRNHPISRKDIAAATGLSRASVSYGIEELIGQGIVVEKGNSSGSVNGGPRPINLQIDADHAFVITALIRKNEPIMQVDNLLGETKATYCFQKKNYEAVSEVLPELDAFAHQALEEFGSDRILGVGVSVPGNVENNRIVNAPVGGLTNLDVAGMLSESLKKNVYLERDVHSMAYGEHWQGNGRQYDDFIAVWCGTGIGSAAMINQKLVRGASGLAGEIGFMAVGPEAYREKPYTLNGFGHFESIASVQNIENKYGQSIMKLMEAEEISPELEHDLYRISDILAIGLTNMILLLNPSAILINGRLRYAQRVIQDYLKQQVQRLCPVECKIEYSFLGTKAILLGGTYLVLKKELGISL